MYTAVSTLKSTDEQMRGKKTQWRDQETLGDAVVTVS